MRHLVHLLAVGALLMAPAGLPAQQGAAAADPAALRVTLLGTAGGPPAHADRSQPANLLRIDGRSYLLDAGENVAQQLIRVGVPASRIDVAFITHLHWDHILGLGYLMATGWMLGRTQPLPIYGPPGLAEYVGRETAALEVGEDIFRAQTPNLPALKTLYPVEEKVADGPTQIYRDASVRVTAVPNTHYDGAHVPDHAYGKDRSYAYRFDTAKGSVVFTGDTGPSKAVTDLARGADVLVTEICDVDSIRAAMQAVQPKANLDALVLHMREQHLGPEEVGRMAAAAGVRKVVLTHFVIGQRFDPDSFVARIRPFYKGEVVVGKDLLTVDVPAR